MDDGSILTLAALVALIALSGFFSAVETAFASLNEIRLKNRAEDGDAAAARVLAMAQQHDRLFATVLPPAAPCWWATPSRTLRPPRWACCS